MLCFIKQQVQFIPRQILVNKCNSTALPKYRRKSWKSWEILSIYQKTSAQRCSVKFLVNVAGDKYRSELLYFELDVWHCNKLRNLWSSALPIENGLTVSSETFYLCKNQSIILHELILPSWRFLFLPRFTLYIYIVFYFTCIYIYICNKYLT